MYCVWLRSLLVGVRLLVVRSAPRGPCFPSSRRDTLAAMGTPATPTPAAPTQGEEIAATVIHDIFVLGLAAAAFFVKNPQSQQKAATIVSILQSLQFGQTPVA